MLELGHQTMPIGKLDATLPPTNMEPDGGGGAWKTMFLSKGPPSRFYVNGWKSSSFSWVTVVSAAAGRILSDHVEPTGAKSSA